MSTASNRQTYYVCVHQNIVMLYEAILIRTRDQGPENDILSI